ncbi:MAG: FAD-dependent oxidoreductase, partial [Gammaproteobacteria bacterium]|nr:FAD-dependent oxidoreductase [Gammaproteobacteria bacterium]
MNSTTNSNPRVIVIGGGIVGLAIADALCRRGAKVTVLERRRIAKRTTDNSFAWLNATSKTSDEAYHRLNAAGLDAWRRRAREFGEDVIGLYPRGMIEWVDGDNADAAADLDRRLARLTAWNYAVHPVDSAELHALEPHFE